MNNKYYQNPQSGSQNNTGGGRGSNHPNQGYQQNRSNYSNNVNNTNKYSNPNWQPNNNNNRNNRNNPVYMPQGVPPMNQMMHNSMYYNPYNPMMGPPGMPVPIPNHPYYPGVPLQNPNLTAYSADHLKDRKLLQRPELLSQNAAGQYHLFLHKIPPNYNQEILFLNLVKYGPVDKIKMERDHTGRSLGRAIVCFKFKPDSEIAKKDILRLNIEYGQPMIAHSFLPMQKIHELREKYSFLISLLPHDVTEKELQRYFFSFGELLDIQILKPVSSADEDSSLTYKEAVITYMDQASVDRITKQYREEGISFGDKASQMIALTEFQIYLENFENEVIEHPDWPKHTTPVQDHEILGETLSRIIGDVLAKHFHYAWVSFRGEEMKPFCIVALSKNTSIEEARPQIEVLEQKFPSWKIYINQNIGVKYLNQNKRAIHATHIRLDVCPKEIIHAFRKFGYVMKLRLFQHSVENWLLLKITYENEIITPELEIEIRACSVIRKLFVDPNCVQINNFSEESLPIQRSKQFEQNNLFISCLNQNYGYQTFIDTFQKYFGQLNSFIIKYKVTKPAQTSNGLVTGSSTMISSTTSASSQQNKLLYGIVVTEDDQQTNLIVSDFKKHEEVSRMCIEDNEKQISYVTIYQTKEARESFNRINIDEEDEDDIKPPTGSSKSGGNFDLQNLLNFVPPGFVSTTTSSSLKDATTNPAQSTPLPPPGMTTTNDQAPTQKAERKSSFNLNPSSSSFNINPAPTPPVTKAPPPGMDFGNNAFPPLSQPVQTPTSGNAPRPPPPGFQPPNFSPNNPPNSNKSGPIPTNTDTNLYKQSSTSRGPPPGF